MSTVILEPEEWAQQEFAACELGDVRRNRRLITVAVQAAARPDGSTPDQTETWADCKAAYRLFDQEDVTFQAIVSPHCQRTRSQCAPGSVKLLLNDTTEIDFGRFREIEGAGPTGRGTGQGFFLHSALMVDETTGQIEGLAQQELFYRRPRTKKEKKSTVARRKCPHRESLVWGRVIDAIGRPPAGVRWLHICDRGADDYEVFCHAIMQGTGFVIRAAKLNRKVLTADGQEMPLQSLLATLPTRGEERQVTVPTRKGKKGRTARVALRYTMIRMPRPRIQTEWIRRHAPLEPLTLWVVELREIDPPKNVQEVRWVLYTTEPVTCVAEAEKVIQYYECRPIIEDYHKGLKTGCHVEERYYHTAARLERVTAMLSILAVRLLQMRTAARETPNRPACEVAPARWVELLCRTRRKPNWKEMTIDQFLRQLAGLGGHLGRRRDGAPGWITLWRGLEKFLLILRGADEQRKRNG